MTDAAPPEIEGAGAAPPDRDADPGGPRLNANNLLNIAGYLLSLVASYLGGVAGWFGGRSNAEVSSEYQTLITPAASYFGPIWAVIFLFEGLFAVAQLLPRYRDAPLVRDGIGGVFSLACCAQAAWTVTFGFEMMVSAFVSISFLLASLLTIVRRQWGVVDEEVRRADASPLGEEAADDATARPPRPPYWILRFPFALHAGWISAAAPAMLCVLLTYEGADPKYEMWASVVSVPLVFGACAGLLLRKDPGAPSYAFPAAVAYACAGTCWELQAPSNVVLARHDEASVTLMKNLSGFCAVCLGVIMLSRCVVLFVRDQCTRWQERDDMLSVDGGEYPYVRA